MKKKNWAEYIGCTAVIDKEGLLWIAPGLKTYKMSGRSAYPEYRIIGDDNQGNLLLTSDGLFVSRYPKKLTKIL